MKIIKMKKGMAMVELILAIVVMSVIILAAPSLMSQAKVGIVIAAKQSAISTAAANIEMIMTREWDDEGTDDSIYPTILNVSLAGSNLLDMNDTTGRREGTPSNSQRTFFSSVGTTFNATVPSAFSDADADDIDDANGQTRTLAIADGNVKGDHADRTIQMTNSVNYILIAPTGGSFDSRNINIPDPFGVAASAGTTNVKLISTQLRSGTVGNADFRKNITLRAFSSNIGSYKLDERKF